VHLAFARGASYVGQINVLLIKVLPRAHRSPDVSKVSRFTGYSHCCMLITPPPRSYVIPKFLAS
jgi:hypothetical protein